jgi:hypothetical protein
MRWIVAGAIVLGGIVVAGSASAQCSFSCEIGCTFGASQGNCWANCWEMDGIPVCVCGGSPCGIDQPTGGATQVFAGGPHDSLGCAPPVGTMASVLHPRIGIVASNISSLELPVVEFGAATGAESWGHGVARFARPEPIALSHGSAPLNFQP